MSNSLPPDLQRLGDELAGAAARTAAAARLRREERRRVAITAALCALLFATLTPAALGPAHRDVRLAGALQAWEYARPGCDHPRGTGFMLPACEAASGLPMQRHRPYAWR